MAAHIQKDCTKREAAETQLFEKPSFGRFERKNQFKAYLYYAALGYAQLLACRVWLQAAFASSAMLSVSRFCLYNLLETKNLARKTTKH